MRRLTMMAGAVGVALMMSSGAFAQVPADPANPNEAVPEKMPNTPYGEPINLETPRRLPTPRRGSDQTRMARMCIAIVGPTGDLVYFEKMDGCQYASVDISQHKARAAARYRRPTVVFERLIGKGAFFAYLPTLGRRLHRLARRQSDRRRRQDHRRDRRIRRHRIAGRHDLAGRRRGAEIRLSGVANNSAGMKIPAEILMLAIGRNDHDRKNFNGACAGNLSRRLCNSCPRQFRRTH